MTETRKVDFGNGVRLNAGCGAPFRTASSWCRITITPPAPALHPTILMRQPYGRDIASTSSMPIPHGCAAWLQRRNPGCARPAATRVGEFYPFRNEARDGAETIAWLLDPAGSERPPRHVRLLLSGYDAVARGFSTTGRVGMHRSGHDGP